MAGSLEEALGVHYKFIIDNDLRTIQVPDGMVFGVYNDRNVQTIDFEMPRYYHGDLDLSEFSIRINFLANNDGHIYLVTDKTVGENTITFSWTVDIYAYEKNGDSVVFSVCLRKVGSNNQVLKEFNTTTTSVGVLLGLEVEEHEEDIPIVVDYLSQIQQIYEDVVRKYNIVLDNTAMTDSYCNRARDYKDDAEIYKDEAKGYRDQAAAIVTPDGLAARVLALEDLGFSADSDDYLVQEADD